MKAFVGVWKLTSLKHILTTGKTIYPMGRRPEGRLLFTKEGFVSVSLSAGSRKRFKKQGIFQGKQNEKAEAFDSYLNYCGRFRIEGKRLFIEVELSLFPNWKGTTQIRNFRFEKSKLFLWTRSFVHQNEDQVAHLEWKKI